METLHRSALLENASSPIDNKRSHQLRMIQGIQGKVTITAFSHDDGSSFFHIFNIKHLTLNCYIPQIVMS